MSRTRKSNLRNVLQDYEFVNDYLTIQKSRRHLHPSLTQMKVQTILKLLDYCPGADIPKSNSEN